MVEVEVPGECQFRLRRCGMLAMCWLLTGPAAALAQTDLQLWGNITLDWMKSERLVYELDFEPKVLLERPEGEPGWHNLDVTPNVEYSPNGWLDLVGEATLGYTKQTNDVNSVEVSPRVGIRLHLFSRYTDALIRKHELSPKRRLVVRDLVRVESRNFIYSGAGRGTDSSWRFRNRLEFLLPINKPKLTDDGAAYTLADWEWFVPLDEPEERFASRQRIRTGLGYRRSAAWRYEVLYMWTRSRNTIEDGFSTSDNIIDVRVKRAF
jgi:hypothetical protein